MKKYILTIFLMFATYFVFAQTGKNDENTKEWKYEISCVDVAKEGGYLIRVFTYANSRKLAIEQAKKNAVHGVLFKGFIGSDKCASQKALFRSPTAEIENKDFFNVFFDNNKYQKYVTLSTDGNIDPNDIVKVGKEYKLGIIVTIAKDALRKDLEAAGILKNISDRY